MPADLMPTDKVTSTPTDTKKESPFTYSAQAFFGSLLSQASDGEILPPELALRILIELSNHDLRKSLAATSTDARRAVEYAKFIALKEQLEQLPVFCSLAEFLLYAPELNDSLLRGFCWEMLGEEIVLSHSISQMDEESSATTDENIPEASGPISLEMYFRETQDLMWPHLRNPKKVSSLFYDNGTLESEQEVRVEDGDNVEEFWENLLQKAELARTHIALFDTPDPSADYTVLNDFLRHARAFERFLADVKLMWEISTLAYQRAAMHQPLDGFFSCVPGDRWLTAQQQFMEAAKPILEDEGLMARISSRVLLALADFGVADYLLAAFMQHPQLNQLTPGEMDFLIEQEVFASFLQQCVKDNTPDTEVFIERNLSKNQLLRLFNIHPQNARLLQSSAVVNKLNDDELVEIITTKLGFLGYFGKAIQDNSLLVTKMTPKVCLKIIEKQGGYERRVLAEPKLMVQFNNMQLFDILKQTSSKFFLIFAQHCGNYLDKLTQEQFLRLVKEYSLLSDLETEKSIAFIQLAFLKKFAPEYLDDDLKSLTGVGWLENEETRKKVHDAYQAYLDAKEKHTEEEAIREAEDRRDKDIAIKELKYLRLDFALHLLNDSTDVGLRALAESDIGLEDKAIRTKMHEAYRAYLDAKKKQAEDEARKKAEDAEKNLAMKQLSYLRYYAPHLLMADPHLQPLEKSEVGLEDKAIRIKVHNAFDASVKALREQVAADAAKKAAAVENAQKPSARLLQSPVSRSSDLSLRQSEQAGVLSTPSVDRVEISQIALPQEQPKQEVALSFTPPIDRLEVLQVGAQPQELPESAVSFSVPPLVDQIEPSPIVETPQEPPQDQKSLSNEEQSHEVSVNEQAPAMLQNQLSPEASQVVVLPPQAPLTLLSHEEQPRDASVNEQVPVLPPTTSQHHLSLKPYSQHEQPAERVATAAAIASVGPNLQERAASAMPLSLTNKEEEIRKTNSYQAFSSARIQPQPSYVSLSSLMGSTYGREELPSTNERNIETYPPLNMTRESMVPQDSSTKNLPTVTSASVTGWRWLFRGILGAGGGYLVAGGIAALIKGSAMLGISVAAAPAALALGGLLLLGVWVDIIYRAAISEIASQNSSTHKATQYSPSFRPPSGHTPVYAPSPSQQVVQPQPSTTLSRR